jgi:uncharacterized lipoprotein YajG
MQKQIMSVVLAFVLGTTFFTGCATTPSTPVTESQRVDRLALVLKSTVSGVVSLAAEDRKQETRDHIKTARDLIAKLVSDGQTSPRPWAAR